MKGFYDTRVISRRFNTCIDRGIRSITLQPLNNGPLYAGLII